jgi:ubiquinone/menaquinone biosynthesis C-methylase UbiE
MKEEIESMSTQPNDATRREEGQRQQWASVAAGWKKWWRSIERGGQYVSKRMLELAEIKPGQRVLDIATGIGEPALPWCQISPKLHIPSSAKLYHLKLLFCE